MTDSAVTYCHVLVHLKVVLVNLTFRVLKFELVQSLSACDHLVSVRKLELARNRHLFVHEEERDRKVFARIALAQDLQGLHRLRPKYRSEIRVLFVD